MYLKEALAERYTGYADAGIAYFDRLDPDWWRTDAERPVSTVSLDISSSTCCAMAQHTGVDYFTAKEQLNLSEGFVVTHGFAVANELSDADKEIAFDALTERWCTIIVARRKAEANASREPELELAA